MQSSTLLDTGDSLTSTLLTCKLLPCPHADDVVTVHAREVLGVQQHEWRVETDELLEHLSITTFDLLRSRHRRSGAADVLEQSCVCQRERLWVTCTACACFVFSLRWSHLILHGLDKRPWYPRNYITKWIISRLSLTTRPVQLWLPQVFKKCEHLIREPFRLSRRLFRHEG